MALELGTNDLPEEKRQIVYEELYSKNADTLILHLPYPAVYHDDDPNILSISETPIFPGTERSGLSADRPEGVLAMPQTVAIKVFAAVRDSTMTEYKVLWSTMMPQEVQIHERLDHPNIVRLFEAVCEPRNVFSVMEYCDAKLASYIENHYIRHSSNAITPVYKPPMLVHVVKMMTDVLLGLAYLDEHNVAHLDLKPLNILWSKTGKVWKIADFGHAKALSMETSQHVGPLRDAKIASTALCFAALYGTLLYSAPELAFVDADDPDYAAYVLRVSRKHGLERYRDVRVVSARADVHSLATTVYEMLCGRIGWRPQVQLVRDAMGEDVKYAIRMAEYMKVLKSPIKHMRESMKALSIDPEGWGCVPDILDVMWESDAASRPSASDVLTSGVLKRALEYAALQCGSPTPLGMLEDPLWECDAGSAN